MLFVALFERSLLWFFGLYMLAWVIQFLPFAEPENFFRYSALFALGGLALLWQQRRMPAWGYTLGLLFFSGLIWWQLGVYSMLVGVGTAVAINAIKVRIPFLSPLGKISYSLYLMHGLIGTTAEFILVKLYPPATNASKLVLTAVCLVLAVSGAYVFYQLVEQPFMRLASQKRR